ncbi:unnamed protein product [Chironomus riparius]|uniref:Uncharacterized protein n=1 Tax=Chironomus riparius TaxID=315576 RepID=A0A9N9WU84_9DIPT|nr:unnamed protein product [Chironomus riparius]
MKCIPFIYIALIVGCVYSTDSNNSFEDDEFSLIIAEIQNKIKVITDASNFNTEQINANSQALKNIQTQLDEVMAINAATMNQIDANNAILNGLIPAQSEPVTTNDVPSVDTTSSQPSFEEIN